MVRSGRAHDLVAQGTTTLTLEDVGAAVHNLTVDALGLQVVATPGSQQPGVDRGACSRAHMSSTARSPGHRAAGMVGSLIVE